MMKIRFLGAAQEVGRSCILVQCGKKKILLDCGIKLHKKEDEFPLIDRKLARKIDAVILSHGHLDHCGFLPFLSALGFHGVIYSTKPTRDIVQLLLADYMRVCKSENKKVFSDHDMINSLRNFRFLEMYKKTKIFRNIFLTLYPAGHLLGACGIRLQYDDKSLYYTGDMSGRESNLLDKADNEIEDVDYLITESTYGGKNDITPSLKNASRELAEIIKETAHRGGKILIPTFGVGRAQEVMVIVDNYLKSGFLPDIPCYLDGMIKKANKIYRHNVLDLKEEIPKRILVSREDPFESTRFRFPKTKDKSDVFKHGAALILSTSGMMSGGPVLHYFEKMAGNPENTLVLVGYQAQGTLGRELVEGAQFVRLPNEKEVEVRMKIKKVNLSAHSDRMQLVEFPAKMSNLKGIFLVHGDAEKMKDLAEEFRKKHHTHIPKLGEEFTL